MDLLLLQSIDVLASSVEYGLDDLRDVGTH